MRLETRSGRGGRRQSRAIAAGSQRTGCVDSKADRQRKQPVCETTGDTPRGHFGPHPIPRECEAEAGRVRGALRNRALLRVPPIRVDGPRGTSVHDPGARPREVGCKVRGGSQGPCSGRLDADKAACGGGSARPCTSRGCPAGPGEDGRLQTWSRERVQRSRPDAACGNSRRNDAAVGWSPSSLKGPSPAPLPSFSDSSSATTGRSASSVGPNAGSAASTSTSVKERRERDVEGQLVRSSAG